MFGVRLSSLFTSRWMALLWGVLICLTAVQFVAGQGKSDAGDDAANVGDPAQIAAQGIKAADAAF